MDQEPVSLAMGQDVMGICRVRIALVQGVVFALLAMGLVSSLLVEIIVAEAIIQEAVVLLELLNWLNLL